MSAITDVKCVLTQKALDAFCNKFHIPEEVHPVLPNQNDTMHERPAGKIGLYTRFFDFANFRLPLSTFLVDVLRHFRINISQLSVIGAAKVSHFEILCRVYGIIPTVGLFRCFYVNSKKSGWMSFSKRSDNASVCYTKPIDSLKNWNDHFFWVDDFACPASFPWHTAKHVIRDPAPVAADFNEQDYATLVAHPSPFRKFPEAFLCLVGLSRHYTLDEETYPWFLHKNGEEMDIFAFIHTPDPTKVKIVERERNEGEPLLLETTIGRTVPLLPVAPDRAESELDASVERLFDEGGSGNQTEQGDSAGGGKDADIQPVIEAADTVVEDVAPVQPKHQGKRKFVVVDTGEASHPPKKLREDHGTPSGTFVGGKSMYAVKRLLVGAALNTEFGVAAVPTLPFMTASISTTLEREGGDHTDSVAGLNLRAIGAPPRFVISSDSSHHSGTNVAEAKVNSLVLSSILIMTTVTTITSTADPASVAKEKLVEPSSFCFSSSSADRTDPTTGGFSDLTGSDFLVGAIDAFLCLVGLNRHYTLDEETYPWFLHKDEESGCLPLYVLCILQLVVLFLTIRLLCAKMDIFTFIQTPDPTKVKIVERERNEGEPLLLETTIGRTVPLLPVAPDRAKSKLKASVERIFDEGGSGDQTEQGDSTGGVKDADI
ncbi:hypothetical protein Tco_0982732 [Tanacetum coccineum]